MKKKRKKAKKTFNIGLILLTLSLILVVYAQCGSRGGNTPQNNTTTETPPIVPPGSKDPEIPKDPELPYYEPIKDQCDGIFEAQGLITSNTNLNQFQFKNAAGNNIPLNHISNIPLANSSSDHFYQFLSGKIYYIFNDGKKLLLEVLIDAKTNSISEVKELCRSADIDPNKIPAFTQFPQTIKGVATPSNQRIVGYMDAVSVRADLSFIPSKNIVKSSRQEDPPFSSHIQDDDDEALMISGSDFSYLQLSQFPSAQVLFQGYFHFWGDKNPDLTFNPPPIPPLPTPPQTCDATLDGSNPLASFNLTGTEESLSDLQAKFGFVSMEKGISLVYPYIDYIFKLNAVRLIHVSPEKKFFLTISGLRAPSSSSYEINYTCRQGQVNNLRFSFIPKILNAYHGGGGLYETVRNFTLKDFDGIDFSFNTENATNPEESSYSFFRPRISNIFISLPFSGRIDSVSTRNLGIKSHGISGFDLYNYDAQNKILAILNYSL